MTYGSRLALPVSLSANALPTVIKKELFISLAGVNRLMDSAYEEASSIVAKAHADAEDILANCENTVATLKENARQQGVKEAQVEVAARMTELSAMTAQFFSDFELNLVEIVTNAVREIIQSFDDKELVLATVRAAANSVNSSTVVSLWVSPEVHSHLSEGIVQLVAPASLSIKPDPVLSGSQCRIDNGRIIVIGDSTAQIEAIRTALKRSLRISRAA